MSDTAPNLAWTLYLGIHSGTITSRNSESPKLMASLDECRREADAAQKFYARMGFHIWYCYAVGPDNERITLIEGALYL